jgi:PHD/YefM family antitoxin component YafN of YafNO toxin-antitoxin module
LEGRKPKSTRLHEAAVAITRAHLKEVMDQVVEDHNPALITRQNG